MNKETQYDRDSQNGVTSKWHYTNSGDREMTRLPSDTVDRNQRANYDPDWGKNSD